MLGYTAKVTFEPLLTPEFACKFISDVVVS